MRSFDKLLALLPEHTRAYVEAEGSAFVLRQLMETMCHLIDDQTIAIEQLGILKDSDEELREELARRKSLSSISYAFDGSIFLEFGNMPHGLYWLHWSNGEGGSLAAVGSDASGRRWYAPTNWIRVPSFDWSKVQKATLLVRRV